MMKWEAFGLKMNMQENGMSEHEVWSWDDAQMFLAVAEQGSFSAAATAMGVGQATVSRRVALLEEQLGGALFVRGRRGTTLTLLGARMLPAAQQMSRWATELRAAVAQEESGIRGKVTVASATGIASEFLVPFAVELRRVYPELRLEFRTGVDYLDLTRGEADIAMRDQRATDPALISFPAGVVTMRPHASPEYLARLEGAPVEAARIDWIGWSATQSHLFPMAWLEELVPGFEPVFSADEILLQVAACQRGLGAMLLPALAHRLIADSGLRPFEVKDFPEARAEIFLVCARSMQHVPRVRAVLDALLAELDLMTHL